jgi:hypothetical protein
MKDFSQYISEAFNRPYRWRVDYTPRESDLDFFDYSLSTKATPIIWDYSFVTSDGDKIVVDIKYRYSDRSITIGFALDENGDYIEDLTDTGDPFRIFATVIDIAKHFLKTASIQINKIKFSASKANTNRVNLYHRFAKRFGNQAGYGKISTKNYSNDVEYELTKG